MLEFFLFSRASAIAGIVFGIVEGTDGKNEYDDEDTHLSLSGILRVEQDLSQDIQDKVFEQDKRKPIAFFITAERTDIQQVEHHKIQEHKDSGGDDLYHELLADHPDNRLSVPYPTCLVKQPPADKEECWHAE